jgi:polysaccharide export outer membrane protein
MEVKEIVRNHALKYYKDPLVNVRIANFYITVLGEVKRPGLYIVGNEKINIIDAIGLAGDLSLGGKRGNVIIIREENGESVFKRVSLNATDIVQSEYYYLQSGDKIYIEPLKAFARAGTSDERATRFVSLTLGVVSVLVAAVTLATRL